jgi:hypothetical protein
MVDFNRRHHAVVAPVCADSDLAIASATASFYFAFAVRDPDRFTNAAQDSAVSKALMLQHKIGFVLPTRQL